MGVMKRIATSNQIGGNGLRIKTEMFFDRAAVVEAVGRAAKALSKAGAFIQRRAKSSIRKRKRASLAASRPAATWARCEIASISASIRPAGRSSSARRPSARSALCRRRSNSAGRPRGTRIPAGASGRWATAAKSGWTARHVHDEEKPRREAGHLRHAANRAQVDRANRLNEELYGPEFIGGGRIEPRPYMGPALREETQNLPAMWAGSVK